MNEEIIDELINEIILNFENDDTINTIIKKISSMRGKKINKEGNIVFIKDPNFIKTIEVNSGNKTIEVLEKGSKKEESKYKTFESNTYYNINDGNGLVLKKNIDESYIKYDDYDLKKQEENLLYRYYDQGKRNAINIEKIIKTTKSDKQGNIINTKNDKVNIINYYLIYNDYIQRKEVNGVVNYSYFNRIDNKALVKTEITEEDFKRLVLYKDNYYEILNDKVFIRTRK